MKQTIYLLALGCSCILLSCNDSGQSQKNNADSKPKTAVKTRLMDGNSSQMITIDSANKMLQSYLNSINYTGTDTNLTAVIFNADSLRGYLNDTTNGKIAFVKLMFAHTLSYINNGGANQNCGYNNNNLTLIVAGYDTLNNYVYYGKGMVLDRGLPCPSNCPPTGTASNYILPPPLSK